MRRQTTYIAKDIKKTWRLVDADGQSLGRLAAEVAVVLMGKHKPEYTPFADCGDNVIIINSKKVGLTGKKAEQKLKLWYTGYPGGQRARTYGQVRESKPETLIGDAVRRMLPKNRLGRVMLSNMKVYPTADHPHKDVSVVEMKI